MEDAGRGEEAGHEDELTLRGSLRPAGPVHFGITEVKQPGVVRLVISGELDILTTPRLATELDRYVRRSDEDVIVDLRATKFIDSSGLQILLGTQRRLARAARTLTVVCDEGPVRRVFELTRLDEVLGLRRGDQNRAGEHEQ